MPLSSPHQWSGGESWEAAKLNTVSTAIEDRAGNNGPIEIEDSMAIHSGADGDRYIGLPSGTTAQRPTGAVG